MRKIANTIYAQINCSMNTQNMITLSILALHLGRL